MRLCSWTIIGLALFGTANARATLTSYRAAHPTGWMYQAPVGETPGWSSSFWINLEFNHANIWNNEFSMTDRRTGDVYTYKADFEQSSAILDFGFALAPALALEFEVPYANRNGGFLDDFIDQFHQFVNTERFLRHLNDEFDNDFSVKTNGQDRLTTQYGQGVGTFKTKLKWWLWQWRSPTPGVCDCGLALSAQAKFPTIRRSRGLSSGNNDYTGMVHLGVPLWKYAGVWMSGAVTKLGPNETFADWPRRDWQQMYELTLDLGFNKTFGFILQARAESPLFMKEYLDYQFTYADKDSMAAERIASGWNSLVEWRGTQAVGLRWRWGKGSRFTLLFVEDWGIGDKENRGEALYVTNAPDVAFVSQLHWVF